MEPGTGEVWASPSGGRGGDGEAEGEMRAETLTHIPRVGYHNKLLDIWMMTRKGKGSSRGGSSSGGSSEHWHSGGGGWSTSARR